MLTFRKNKQSEKLSCCTWIYSLISLVVARASGLIVFFNLIVLLIAMQVDDNDISTYNDAKTIDGAWFAHASTLSGSAPASSASKEFKTL